MTRDRGLALAILCTGMLMIILDGSIVTVALPSIQRDLGFSAGDLTWTVNAYMVPFGGVLLLAGRLGDLLGRKRLFVAGLLLFTLASLLCGLASSQGMLIAARFVQGIGGAMVAAVSLGMIVMLFPEPREQARAIGAFSFTGSAGASIGQVLGGLLTQALNWHWIFFINLPIGLTAAALAWRVLAADTPDRGSRADALGAVLITGGLMLGVYTIVGAGASARTYLLGALSVLCIALFVVRQARIDHPLLPLRVLRSREVAGANLVQLLMVAGLFSFQVHIALYLQDVLGYGALATGLAMLPAAVAIGASSLGLSARVIGRFGPRRVLVAGLLALIVMQALLTRVPADASFALDLLPVLVLSAGFGVALPALMTLGMSAAGPRDAGVVSGLFNTGQQIGGALGVAVLSTLAAARTGGHRTPATLLSGYHLAFAGSTVLLVTALVVALVVLRPARQAEPVPAPVPQL